MSGGGLVVTSFRRNFFCLTEPKNFVGEPFTFSFFMGIDKLFASEGCVTIFRQKFLSHSAKIFRRRHLYFFINFGYRKTLGIKEGVIHVFPSKVFCLAEPKNFVGEPFRVSLFLGIDNFYASEGCVTILCQIFVASQCQNFS